MGKLIGMIHLAKKQLGMDDVFAAVQSNFLHGKPTFMNRIFLDFTMRIALKYVT